MSVAQRPTTSEPEPSDVFAAGFYFTRDEWDSLSEADRSAVLWAAQSPPAKAGGDAGRATNPG
jgi:hypothetical protein